MPDGKLISNEIILYVPVRQKQSIKIRERRACRCKQQQHSSRGTTNGGYQQLDTSRLGRVGYSPILPTSVLITTQPTSINITHCLKTCYAYLGRIKHQSFSLIKLCLCVCVCIFRALIEVSKSSLKCLLETKKAVKLAVIRQIIFKP